MIATAEPYGLADFDTVLDEAIARLQAGAPVEDCVQPYPDLAADLLPLLEVASLTLSTAPITPPAGAQARVRRRVMVAAHARLARPPRWEQSWDRWRTAGLSAAAASAALLLGGGTAVVASAGALPGEPLYPVKLAVEDARLTVTQATGSPEAQAALLSELAERRLDEAKALADRGQPVPAEVVDAAVRHAAAAEDIAAHAPEPVRGEIVASLSSAEPRRVEVLVDLEQRPNTPPPAQTAIARALAQGRGRPGLDDRGSPGGPAREQRGDDRVSPATTPSTPPTAGAGPATTAASAGGDDRDNRGGDQGRGRGGDDGRQPGAQAGAGQGGPGRDGRDQSGRDGARGGDDQRGDRGPASPGGGPGGPAERGVPAAVPQPATTQQGIAPTANMPAVNAGGEGRGDRDERREDRQEERPVVAPPAAPPAPEVPRGAAETARGDGRGGAPDRGGRDEGRGAGEGQGRTPGGVPAPGAPAPAPALTPRPAERVAPSPTPQSAAQRGRDGGDRGGNTSGGGSGGSSTGQGRSGGDGGDRGRR